MHSFYTEAQHEQVTRNWAESAQRRRGKHEDTVQAQVHSAVNSELLTGQKDASHSIWQICAPGLHQPHASGFFQGLYRIEQQENIVNIYLLTSTPCFQAEPPIPMDLNRCLWTLSDDDEWKLTRDSSPRLSWSLMLLRLPNTLHFFEYPNLPLVQLKFTISILLIVGIEKKELLLLPCKQLFMHLKTSVFPFSLPFWPRSLSANFFPHRLCSLKGSLLLLSELSLICLYPTKPIKAANILLMSSGKPWCSMQPKLCLCDPGFVICRITALLMPFHTFTHSIFFFWCLNSGSPQNSVTDCLICF